MRLSCCFCPLSYLVSCPEVAVMEPVNGTPYRQLESQAEASTAWILLHPMSSFGRLPHAAVCSAGVSSAGWQWDCRATACSSILYRRDSGGYGTGTLPGYCAACNMARRSCGVVLSFAPVVLASCIFWHPIGTQPPLTSTTLRTGILLSAASPLLTQLRSMMRLYLSAHAT